MKLLLVLVLVGMVGRASAQSIATEAAPRPVVERVPVAGWGYTGKGVTLSFGQTRGEHDNRANGWLVRAEYEQFPRLDIGGTVGFMTGLELYGRTGARGASLPFVAVLAARVPTMRYHLGVGVDAFAVDEIDGAWKASVLSPMMTFGFSLDLPVRIGCDTRFVRRIALDGNDFSVTQLTVNIGVSPWWLP